MTPSFKVLCVWQRSATYSKRDGRTNREGWRLRVAGRDGGAPQWAHTRFGVEEAKRIRVLGEVAISE